MGCAPIFYAKQSGKYTGATPPANAGQRRRWLRYGWCCLYTRGQSVYTTCVCVCLHYYQAPSLERLWEKFGGIYHREQHQTFGVSVCERSTILLVDAFLPTKNFSKWGECV